MPQGDWLRKVFFLHKNYSEKLHGTKKEGLMKILAEIYSFLAAVKFRQEGYDVWVS